MERTGDTSRGSASWRAAGGVWVRRRPSRGPKSGVAAKAEAAQTASRSTAGSNQSAPRHGPSGTPCRHMLWTRMAAHFRCTWQKKRLNPAAPRHSETYARHDGVGCSDRVLKTAANKQERWREHHQSRTSQCTHSHGRVFIVAYRPTRRGHVSICQSATDTVQEAGDNDGVAGEAEPDRRHCRRRVDYMPITGDPKSSTLYFCLGIS